MPRVLAQLAIFAVVSSASAPVVGGFLTSWFGWRSVFGAQLLIAAAVAWLTWKHLPETRPATLAPPAPREMARVAGTLLAKPQFMSCVLQSSAAYSMFVVFISLAPYVMVSSLGRSATEYGLYYPLISFGYVAGNWALGRLGGYSQHAVITLGVSLQMVAALAALAFVAAGLRHPLWIFLPMGLLYFGQGLFMPHLTAIAVNLAPPHATGVGSSTLGFLNQFVSAICVQAMGLVGVGSPMPMLLFCAGAALFQLFVMRLSPRLESARRSE
jgi:DHA1 family bicyclomycin/chloramphenicol resistance-like MFS transporter